MDHIAGALCDGNVVGFDTWSGVVVVCWCCIFSRYESLGECDTVASHVFNTRSVSCRGLSSAVFFAPAIESIGSFGWGIPRIIVEWNASTSSFDVDCDGNQFFGFTGGLFCVSPPSETAGRCCVNTLRCMMFFWLYCLWNKIAHVAQL